MEFSDSTDNDFGRMVQQDEKGYIFLIKSNEVASREYISVMRLQEDGTPD